MNRITEFLKEGSVTLKTVNSPINGELIVKWDILSGYQIMGGGLWQVGGPVEEIWREALNKTPDDFTPKNILILGLGGGSIAKLARKHWNEAEIIGIDIDPEIVKLGQEYLGLGKLDVTIQILDAEAFLKSNKKDFDLICVDMYVGSSYPEKFESEEFISILNSSLSKTGIIIVNRLYYGEKRKKAEAFLLKLKKRFKEITEVYPRMIDNVLYIVKN